MPSSTKQNGQTMADDERDDRDDDEQEERDQREDREERDEKQSLPYRPPGRGEVAREEAGFFHIYKSGQGYWTRMGSVAGAALIILLTAIFLYDNLKVWSTYLGSHRGALLGIIVVVVAALGLLTFWALNKPRNADFLIATDSEMKKVNWTSRQELIGSTKIVILFVLIITGFLFVIDVIFGYTFYFFGVLKTKPF